MKTGIGFYVYTMLIIGLFLVVAYSCKKDDDTGIPVVSTTEVTEIAQITAQSGGLITSDEGFLVSERGICWDSLGNPTISDHKTSNGTGSGSFISELTGLTPGVTYYVRAYATNSKGTGYGSIMAFQTIGNTFTDARDGNVYRFVIIGDQQWMAENLRYLPSIVGPGAGSSTVPYYYVYGNMGTDLIAAKATTYYTTYGALYNWISACSSCPAGWHLPSDPEWTQLITYLEIESGGKLKEIGTTHWNSPNTGATNETGFTALPGGYRELDGMFNYAGSGGFWWSASANNTDAAWYRSMHYNSHGITRISVNKDLGISVRCVRDN